MSEGLIDGLVPYCFGVCMDDPESPGFEEAKTTLVQLDDLRDLLRSDETREALGHAIHDALRVAVISKWTPERLVTDAVVRVLTGEEDDH